MVDDLEVETRNVINSITQNAIDVSISNDVDFEAAIHLITTRIFNKFKEKYQRIKDNVRYKNIFLNAVRQAQDELLQNPLFQNALSQVNEIDGNSDNNQPFFEAINTYCRNRNITDKNEVIIYLVTLKSLLGVYHVIGGHYLNREVIANQINNVDTMTDDKKMYILKYLIDNQEQGTIDGNDIARDFGVNVKHVMNLLEIFEQKKYIDYFGMAQYYFQVTVRLEGEEFYDNYTFITNEKSENSPLTSIIHKMSDQVQDKPYVFIGSSAEGLEVAKAIQAGLNHACEPHIWSQGLFGLSSGTLETLVKSLTKFDFAIFVLRNDDVTVSRNQESNSPRDNVLLELGMFIGSIGTERTFMVVDKSAKIKLPSDLAGITPALFTPPNKGTMQASVGPACYEIELAFKKYGIRADQSLSNSNDFEIDKKLITEYLMGMGFKAISYEKLFDMNPSYTQDYILSLVKNYPDYFRLASAKGKSGIALSKFIIPM